MNEAELDTDTLFKNAILLFCFDLIYIDVYNLFIILEMLSVIMTNSIDIE